ncbi:MAG: T9SS type A sorting domain-containing protein [Bacteroidia bacterium]|nr:T9SS type A sorting domain-containing protein [Bacteroidia bacterium]
MKRTVVRPLSRALLTPYHGLLLLFTLLISTGTQAQNRYWYGSLHSHSEYSDGNMANDTAYRTAKSCFEYIQQNTAHVDFWGISDHNHGSAGMALADYHRGWLEADSVNQDNLFSTFYGMEWGVISSGGHVIIHGMDSLIGWETGNYDLYNGQSDYNGLFNKIAARTNTAFAYLAHMEDSDYGNLLAAPFNPQWDSAIVGLALRNGPAFSTDTTYGSLPSFHYFDRYLDLLKKGYHVAPGIDHDNHYIVFGRTHPGRTVIIADSLNRNALLQAIRRRSFYASDDWNAKVSFGVSGFAMGSICSAAADPHIRLSITDPDNESTGSIRIWSGVAGSGSSATILYSTTGIDSLDFIHVLPAGSSRYYFAEITQSDGDKIWTAPVWYTSNANPPPFELIDFTAQRAGEHAVLQWSTVNEFNLDRIDIEKSTDALQFFVAGSRSPAGGLGLTTTYNWTDPQTLDTSTYYRLNAYDLSGLSQLSPLRRVDPALLPPGASIYPNPSSGGDTWIALSNTRQESIRMEIFNAEGKLMYSAVYLSEAGILYLPFRMEAFARGLYTVRFHNSDYSFNISNRFIRY